jgi:hypothetical protein
MRTTDKILKLINQYYKDVSVFPVGWSEETQCLIEEWSFKTYNAESNFTGSSNLYLSIKINNKLHGDFELLITYDTIKFVSVPLDFSLPSSEEILAYIQAIIKEKQSPLQVNQELKKVFDEIEQLERSIKNYQKALKYKIEERETLLKCNII